MRAPVSHTRTCPAGRTLGEAGQVFADALREGAKERAASKCWDGDVGRHGPPIHELILKP